MITVINIIIIIIIIVVVIVIIVILFKVRLGCIAAGWNDCKVSPRDLRQYKNKKQKTIINGYKWIVLITNWVKT